MSTGTLQERVLSPLLFKLLTHDRSASVNNNDIIKFTVTTVVGLITSNDESAYREKVELLAAWCLTHKLDLSIKKDQGEGNRFKRTGYQHHLPLIVNGSKVERVHSTQFLEIHLTDKLPASTMFYWSTTESILTYCTASWFSNNTVEERHKLNRTVKTWLPQRTPFMFTLVQSWKTYTSMRTRTTRLLNSFFPTVIRLLNQRMRTAQTGHFCG